MSDITVYQDNLSPTISDTLTKDDGSVFDLSNCAVVFKMRRKDSPALAANHAASVISGPAGTWSYTWQAGDTHNVGVFKAWLTVTPSGGQAQDTPEFIVNILAHAPLPIGSGYARAMAREKVRLFADTGTCPEISDPAEVEFLLDMSRIMDKYGAPPPKGFTWYPGILLGVGTYVVPAVPNGHYYSVTAMTTSPGYIEPTWSLTSGGSVVQDGVTYTEQGGMSWEETYDSNYCIAQAWLMKAGRIASYYNFMVAGKMFSRQQFYDHCMKQYRMYAAKARLKAIRLATPLIGQSLSNIPLWNDVPSNWS